MGNWKGIVGIGFTPDKIASYINMTAKSWQRFPVLHNTAVPTLNDWLKGQAIDHIHGLERYYRDDQHWSAGPHFFVAPDLIWAFTPLSLTGVHSPSWNSVAVGVEMIGDYATESFDSGPGLLVQQNTVVLLARLCMHFGWDSSSMKIHKEDPNTTHDCPGRNVVKAKVVQAVHDKIVALRG